MSTKNPRGIDSPFEAGKQIPIASDTARRMLELRKILDEGIARAFGESESERGTATVLLDAAAERTMALCASQLGIEVAEKEKFDGIAAKLRTRSNSWSEPLWKSVEQLHRSRNLAQHLGVPVDTNFLRRTARQVERFVQILIDATFDRPLHSFAYADAINNEALRASLREIEAVIERKDASFLPGAFRSLILSFDAALDIWRDIHDNAIPAEQGWTRNYSNGPYQVSWPIGPDQPPTKPGSLALMHARNPIDYIWFEAFRGDRQIATTSDILRGLTFVVDWIVSLETFSSTYRRRDRSPSTTMSEEGDSIGQFLTVGPPELNDPSALLTLTVVGIPLSYRSVWKLAFDSELNRHNFALLGEPELNGRIHIKTFYGHIGLDSGEQPEPFDPSKVSEAIRFALEVANRAAGNAHREDNAIDTEVRAAQMLAEELREIRVLGLPLFREIQVRPVERQFRSGDRYRTKATLNLPEQSVPLLRTELLAVAADHLMDLNPPPLAGGAQRESLVVGREHIEFSDRHAVSDIRQLLDEAINRFLPSYQSQRAALDNQLAEQGRMFEAIRNTLLPRISEPEDRSDEGGSAIPSAAQT